MKKILTEKQFQRHIIDFLVANHGYVERTNATFDRSYAMDTDLFFRFLEETQPDEMVALRKIYKEKTQKTILGAIQTKIMSASSSLLEILKDGIEVNRTKLTLLYTPPESSLNPALSALAEKNIFSVAEEVYASNSERIDLVIFLNGFAIMTLELKCNTAGQSYEDAIHQYRFERNPDTRLFLFKAGAIVNFAVDLLECHMTTRLTGPSTYFLPFNKGRGTGINTGKGNPENPNGYRTAYLWEEILQKNRLIEILTKFSFVERQELKGKPAKAKKDSKILFPRFHQLDCVRSLLADVRENHTSQNYLIQHSAGSGKTYTISWLAHRLATLHDELDHVVFDNVVIVTDRVVVDRQLQRAVQSIAHQVGFIKVMNDKTTSSDLQRALEGNSKIVVATIQKFLYIYESTRALNKRNFAVIIDEAHSSTAGKSLAAVTGTLGSEATTPHDTVEFLKREIAMNGKQKNVSIFAFTATPKASTLELFGRLNPMGQREAFHLYSMKQAIEEGFILNVLESFTPYKTFYKINKTTALDPLVKNSAAKRKIVRYAIEHPENIAQRTEIIVEHFRSRVLREQPWSKAMVVASSRAEAVRYYDAIQKYTDAQGYQNVHCLIAFSDKLTEKEVGRSESVSTELSEASLNGFPESQTPTKFDTEDYQILVVADKYQTGFDQPKLAAMYVLKHLSGIATVQTLSRLNRIYPPYAKRTFVLDFVNTIDSIVNDFKPWYTTTLLCNTVTEENVYALDAEIDELGLFSFDDAAYCYEKYRDPQIAPKKREEVITQYLSKSKDIFMEWEEKVQKEALALLRKFVHYYEFVLQATQFEDTNVQIKYNYIVWLLPWLKTGNTGSGVNLKDKIQASDFFQQKGTEAIKVKVVPDPRVFVEEAPAIYLAEDESKQLSEIIREINDRFGKTFDNDVALKSALQIRDILKKNPDLIRSARTNKIDDFRFPFFDQIDKALTDGLQQNEEFFKLLLNNDDLKKEVFEFFLKSIYKSLQTP